MIVSTDKSYLGEKAFHLFSSSTSSFSSIPVVAGCLNVVHQWQNGFGKEESIDWNA